MANKLNSGDSFPKLTLDIVDGRTLEVPDDLVEEFGPSPAIRSSRRI